MKNFEDILNGGDLRSIGKSNLVVSSIHNQQSFDDLFQQLHHNDRKVVMRTADAIEKITINNPGYLKKHKNALLNLCETTKAIELKWHLALLLSRLSLTKREIGRVWQTLAGWATNPRESRIVRVNSIQGLFNLLQQDKELEEDFNSILTKIKSENVPSINARIRKWRNSI